jgi:hypothetical protein
MSHSPGGIKDGVGFAGRRQLHAWLVDRVGVWFGLAKGEEPSMGAGTLTCRASSFQVGRPPKGFSWCQRNAETARHLQSVSIQRYL